MQDDHNRLLENRPTAEVAALIDHSPEAFRPSNTGGWRRSVAACRKGCIVADQREQIYQPDHFIFPGRRTRQLATAFQPTPHPLREADPEPSSFPPQPNGHDPGPVDLSLLVSARHGRRAWLREGRKMVALIVVLALVGGLLAVALRGEGEQSHVRYGGPPATTAAAAVVATTPPVTVTAGQLPVTLIGAGLQGGQTQFRFQVTLPQDMLLMIDPIMLGPMTTGDIQLQNVVLPKPGTQLMTVNPHLPSSPWVSFTLTLGALSRSSSTVTVTLRRLSLKSASGDYRVFQGPWTFVVGSSSIEGMPQSRASVGKQWGLVSLIWLTFAIVIGLGITWLARRSGWR